MTDYFDAMFRLSLTVPFFSSLGSVLLLSEDFWRAGVAGTAGLTTVTSGAATLPAEDVEIESASASFSGAASGPD